MAWERLDQNFGCSKCDRAGLAGPALRARDVEGILPLAGGCLLLAYIEGVSDVRTFAAKHG